MKKILVIIPIVALFSCIGTKKRTSTAEPIVEVVKQEESNDQASVFQVVEEMPQFPGGMDSLLSYLGRTINYPKEARKKNIEGKVYAEFIVEKSGSISTAKIVRGIGYGCDEEALNAVKNMPVWVPGMQRGKPVRVRMVLPINFSLEAKKN